jgi:hypothetical protein
MAAKVPRTEKEIMLFPGAARDTASEKELLQIEKEDPESIPKSRKSSLVRVYTTKTLINKVCQFYIDKLKAKAGAPIDDPANLEPGEVFPPWYELDFYGPDIFKDQREGDVLIQDGKWIKSAFAKRPQWKKGAWLSQGYFEWNATQANGEMVKYSVLLEDMGFDSRKKIDFQSTRIRIQIEISKSQEEMDDEE